MIGKKIGKEKCNGNKRAPCDCYFELNIILSLSFDGACLNSSLRVLTFWPIFNHNSDVLAFRVALIMQHYTVKYGKIKTYLGLQLTPNDIFIECLSIDFPQMPICH